jgi:surface antigen
MRLRRLSVVALMVTVAMSGCQSGPTKQEVGAVTGGVLGGVLGAQVNRKHETTRTAAIIAGTLVGAAIGGHIGRSLDEHDRMKMAQTLETSPTHQATSWRNPDTGNDYTMTPVKTYEQQGTPCREYTLDAMIGGQPEKVYGTACRQADGSWRVSSLPGSNAVAGRIGREHRAVDRIDDRHRSESVPRTLALVVDH